MARDTKKHIDTFHEIIGQRSCLPIHLLHCIYQGGKTFCFLFLRTKFRNRTMLFDETLFELLDTGIILKRILCNSFKQRFVIKKGHFFKLQHRFYYQFVCLD